MIYKINLKQYFLFIGLISVFYFALSCKSNKNSQDTSKDTLTFLYIGDERIFHQDMWGMEASFWIFLPLVAQAGEYRGEIQPVLAKSWTHSKDYRTWTVKLRKDIYWHDGIQMTAHDIKFTIDLRKEVLINEGNISCELINDFTFTLTSDNPLSELSDWHVYYPKHLLDKLDPAEFFNWNFWVAPIGNGPYRFVRNVPKTMVEVEANPNYFGSQPKVKKAILKFSQTPSLQELLSGNVDAITNVPRDFLFKIKGDDRFTSYYWWGTWVESLFWNHNNPLFKEAKVRKALTMAIDRVELSNVLNYPDDIPITDIMYNHNQKNNYMYSHNKEDNYNFPTPLTYNPAKAIELLEECGWTDTNADGILDKEGLDFEFKLTVSVEYSLMATYIQDKFKQIGILMEIETMEINLVKQRLKKSDFEALIIRFMNDQNVSELRKYFGKNSCIGYKNEKLDSILKLIGDTGDISEIDRLYEELRPIFERDIPITFISPEVTTHIVNSSVKGLENLFRADPVRSLEFLWIE